jgi:hypothetical protein
LSVGVIVARVMIVIPLDQLGGFHELD